MLSKYLKGCEIALLVHDVILEYLSWIAVHEISKKKKLFV